MSTVCNWTGCRFQAVNGDLCQPHAWLEDALWLLDMGESPPHVCTRLGVTIGALEKSLRRHGSRHAAAVNRYLQAQRTAMKEATCNPRSPSPATTAAA